MGTLSRKWLVLGGVASLLIVAVVGYMFFFRPRTANAAVQTGQVTRGDIQSTVLSSAALQPAADLQLTFGSAGTLKTLNVKPGDRVTRGQSLASLDTADLTLAVTQAQANLLSAQAKLDQLKSPPQAKDLLSAQATLKAAQAKLADAQAGPSAADLANARAALDSANAKLAGVQAGTSSIDIASAVSQLDSARAKLDQLKAGPDQNDVKTAQMNLQSAEAKLAQLMAGSTTAQVSAAQVKVTQAETSLEKTASSASLAKQQAEIALDEADHALKNAQNTYYTIAADALDSNGNLLTAFPGSLRGKFKDLADLTNQYYTALHSLQDAEDNYRKAQLSLADARQQEIDSVTAAQATLNDARTQLAGTTGPAATADVVAAQAAVVQAQDAFAKLVEPPAPADVAADQAAVDQAQNSLDKLKQPPATADVKAAQASVVQAQANLDKLTQAPPSVDLAADQKQVDQAQAALDALNAGPLATDLEAAQATVEQAKASLDQANLKVSEASLVAPFAGVVVDVPVTEGQLVGASTEVAELVDDSSYHVDMNVGETDISRVQAGQEVDVSFDALPNDVYTGTVSYVSPKATVQQGVVTYLATVTIDPKAASALRPGMSSTGSVIVADHPNALLVPNRAIHTQGRQKVVYVVGPNGAQIPVTVQTGISDDQSTEIVGDTALREGDSLVISASSAAASANRTGSIINLGGGAVRGAGR